MPAIMKAKQRGVQHHLCSVFLGNLRHQHQKEKKRNDPTDKTPESRDPGDRVSKQQICG